MSPEVKKAIWKVIVYAVTIFASLFAGNVAAKNGIHFIEKGGDDVCVVSQ